MTLWDHEEVLVSEYVDVPPWIEEDISVYDIAAIVQGGCASGAYMPAVTYYQASKTMSEHGDAVLDYIMEHGMEVSFDINEDSWDGFACKVLSLAVDLWACTIEEELIELIEDAE